MVGELARDWGLWGELISYGTGGGGISGKRLLETFEKEFNVEACSMGSSTHVNRGT